MLRADFGQVGVSFGCFASQGGAMDTRWSGPTNVVTGDTRSSAWPLGIARSLIARAVVVGVDDSAEQEILIYEEVVARFGSAPGFELRQEVARALLAKGVAVGRLNRPEEESVPTGARMTARARRLVLALTLVPACILAVAAPSCAERVRPVEEPPSYVTGLDYVWPKGPGVELGP